MKVGKTPGTAGGPGGRDRTLAVKSKKNARKSVFFHKKIKITQFFFAYTGCLVSRVKSNFFMAQAYINSKACKGCDFSTESERF